MKKSKHDSQEPSELQNLSDRIVEFYERLSSWEQSVVVETGLSLPHLHVLEVLGIKGALKMRDLSSQLGVTTGTLTVSIDKLENNDFVRRVSNPKDRRSWLIELTEQGEALHKQHSAYHLKLVKEITQDFNEEEILQISRLFSRLLEHF